MLQRVEGSRDWRVIWQLNQRWVKNNRDPENIVYVSVILYWLPFLPISGFPSSFLPSLGSPTPLSVKPASV